MSTFELLSETERTRQIREQQLEVARKQLSEAFQYIIHEVKSPLTVAMLTLLHTKVESVQQMQRDVLPTLKACVLHSQCVINRMYTGSRYVPRETMTCLHNVVGSWLHGLKELMPLSKAGEIELDVSVDVEEPKVMVDQTAIMQVSCKLSVDNR